MTAPRILVVSPAIPFPPLGGSRTRIYHLLRALSARFDAVLIGFLYGEKTVTPPFPIELITVDWEWPDRYRAMQLGDADATRALTSSAEPWLASILESDRFEAELRRLVAEVDLVIFEGTGMGRFLHSVPSEIPRVLDLYDIHSAMALRDAESQTGPGRQTALAEAERTLKFERRVASACDLCLTCSDVDAARARDLLGVDHVEVIPNGVDTSYFRPNLEPPFPGTLLFSGKMDYSPNVQAAVRFARDILPLVRRRRPEMILHIVGLNPVPEVLALAAPDVVVHGAVPDMRPHYRRAEQVVVPLLHGGGTRLKILEAAASGKAIVTTSIGVEGLRFAPADDLVVADGPVEFAEAIVQLTTDPGRRSRLGAHARAAALAYDWGAIGNEFCKVLLPSRVRTLARI